MPQTPVVDSEAIANLRALSPDDGGTFLKEILGIFIEDTPRRITELHSARMSGDATVFVRAAHSIKGSSSNVGASELRSIAERLELHARQKGIEGVELQVAELEAAFLRAKEELQKLAS